MNMPFRRRHRSAFSNALGQVRDASLFLDFKGQKFVRGGSAGLNDIAPLADMTTYTRASTATYYDANGVLQTAAVNTPRFDYDPATGERLGILLEGQRTNLVTYSEQFDNAAWGKTRATITANATTAPDGTLAADKLVEDTANGEHGFTGPSVSYTSGTTYTVSVYLKSDGVREGARFLLPSAAFGANVQTFFDLSSGTVRDHASFTPLSSSVLDAGNGWYRCAVTAVATATVSNTSLQLRIDDDPADDNVTYTGDGTSGIYIWGAQLEAGSHATSYIPTVASQVTRSADAFDITGTDFSDFYNQSEGTFVVEADYLGVNSGSSNAIISLGSTNTDNIYLDAFSSSLRVVVETASVLEAVMSVGTTPSSSFKIASSLAENDVRASLDASAVSSDTSVALPTVDALAIGGGSFDSVRNSNIHIKSVTYYPRALTNAELQALTTE